MVAQENKNIRDPIKYDQSTKLERQVCALFFEVCAGIYKSINPRLVSEVIFAMLSNNRADQPMQRLIQIFLEKLLAQDCSAVNGTEYWALLYRVILSSKLQTDRTTLIVNLFMRVYSDALEEHSKRKNVVAKLKCCLSNFHAKLFTDAIAKKENVFIFTILTASLLKVSLDKDDYAFLLRMLASCDTFKEKAISENTFLKDCKEFTKYIL